MPEESGSRLNCIEGYIGPLCESCDVYGKVWKTRYGEFGYLDCKACNQDVGYSMNFIA